MTDLLCIAPHPDDAELCCGGLLIQAKRAGLSLAIVDCTRGEMGTRGTAAVRKKEAAAADRMLGLRGRVNLGLRDGHLRDDDALREKLVHVLRRFRPRLVLAPHWEDRHPDHVAVGQAAAAVAWLSGAPKFAPRSAKGIASPQRLPYRPEQVWYYQNRYGIEADLVVDISNVMEQKIALAACYASQVGPAWSKAKRSKREPLTMLSSKNFQQWFRALHSYYGFKIGVEYGEGYCVKGPLKIGSVKAFLSP